jgi:hypothetical protein
MYPVTLAREAPASGSSPRWPTTMTDTIFTTLCSTQLATIGPASRTSRDKALLLPLPAIHRREQRLMGLRTC